MMSILCINLYVQIEIVIEISIKKSDFLIGVIYIEEFNKTFYIHIILNH